MQSQNSQSNQSQMRNSRLMKEWLEIQRCPVENASVSPLQEENLNEWHGNIQGQVDSEWEGIVVHFSISFPAAYPVQPPRVRLFSFVPHLNVQVRGAAFEVCLHMLETPPLGALTTPYQYWSSAFSVRSILVQMASFLLCDGQPTQVNFFSFSFIFFYFNQISLFISHFPFLRSQLETSQELEQNLSAFVARVAATQPQTTTLLFLE